MNLKISLILPGILKKKKEREVMDVCVWDKGRVRQNDLKTNNAAKKLCCPQSPDAAWDKQKSTPHDLPH